MGNEIKKCTIISGAPDEDYDFLSQHIDKNSFIICADSGYLKCKHIDVIPNLIIGDFDSSPYPDYDTEIISLNREKAYTDTFHCVMEAVKRGYNYIEIFCAIGDRIDHTYSNILSLSFCKKNNVKCFISNQKNRISLIDKVGYVPKEYDNFSLFSFMGECKGVSINGAYYTAGFYGKEKLDFELDSQFGQSNFVLDKEAIITVDEGTLLLIESND